MGRHTAAKRFRVRLATPVILVAVVLVATVVGAVVLVVGRDRQNAACPDPVRISVTATPDIAGVIDQVAGDVSAEGGAGCYQVTVTSRDSAEVAEALAVSDGSARPTVWVPESTVWLQRAQSKGAWPDQLAGASVASSPVVIAVTDEVAGDLGWPEQQPSWSQLVGPSANAVDLGFADPSRDPVAIATLLGVRLLAAGASDPTVATTSSIRALATNLASDETELFARLPGAETSAVSSPGVPVKPITGFPTSEVSLLRHNVKEQNTQLVAVYPDVDVPGLDFPFTVLPGADPDQQTAAEKFLGRLIDARTSEALANAGFRTPNGQSLRDRAKDGRVTARAIPPVQLPDARTVDTVLAQWAGVNRAARMQILIDVSGSMNQPIPGTDTTRMTATLTAAEQGIKLFKPTTRFGVWLFSTNLDGDRDYQELLPVRTTSEQVEAGAGAKLLAVKAKEGGATGLYDSVLAAYQSSRQSWEPGRLNLVVILTDGRNEDPNGISRTKLLAELAKLQDPNRPLPIIGMGFGPDIDLDELKELARATGGQAVPIPDASRMAEAFYATLGKLLAPPGN